MNYKPVACVNCMDHEFKCSNCGGMVKIAAYSCLKHIGQCKTCSVIVEEFCTKRVEQLYSCLHPERKLRSTQGGVVCDDCDARVA